VERGLVFVSNLIQKTSHPPMLRATPRRRRSSRVRVPANRPLPAMPLAGRASGELSPFGRRMILITKTKHRRRSRFQDLYRLESFHFPAEVVAAPWSARPGLLPLPDQWISFLRTNRSSSAPASWARNIDIGGTRKLTITAIRRTFWSTFILLFDCGFCRGFGSRVERHSPPLFSRRWEARKRLLTAR